MSSRRERGSKASEGDINDLICKLQAILPGSNSGCTTGVPASKILTATCNHIKRLHREVDDLSERLSQLLASMDTNGVDADILRSLLQQ